MRVKITLLTDTVFMANTIGLWGTERFYARPCHMVCDSHSGAVVSSEEETIENRTFSHCTSAFHCHCGYLYQSDMSEWAKRTAIKLCLQI